MAKKNLEQQAQTFTPSQYNKLKKDLENLLMEGRTRAQKAVSEILSQTYWAMGKCVHEAQISEHAGYKQHLMMRLHEDLDVDKRTLERATALYAAYPNKLPSSGVRWSHYKELLVLPSASARNWYAKQVEKEKYTIRQLRTAIKEKRHLEENSGYKRLRGEERAGAKKVNTKHKLKRPKESTYVFKAEVLRVVDGDTVDVRVDLGFDVYRKQRLRLAGIDTPSVKTEEGVVARDFVIERLGQVPFVMVRTNKYDTYGRFVANIFYQPGVADKDKVFKKGRFLNQELLSHGLATPYV